MLFLQDYTQPFPTWWSTRPAEAPLLSGWAGGPVADRLAGTSVPGLLDAAVDSLAGALGVPRGRVEEQLVSGHLHDWREDPWAMGSYSNVLVGGIDAWKTLAGPLDKTLFFAGEATCGEGMNATMDGALESGWRAAAEAIRATGVNAVVSELVGKLNQQAKGERPMARYGKTAQKKVAKVMRERKRGTLRSGGSGKKVTSRKQAIAIGLSEARRAGAKVPRKRTSTSRSRSRSRSK